MKKIVAVIRPEKLEEVQVALEDAGYPGLMLTRIEGHGKQGGKVEQFRGRQYKVTMLPKYKVEVVCEDVRVPALVEAIIASARTGEVGDGKIFVCNVEDVIRIRTGESGEGAI